MKTIIGNAGGRTFRIIRTPVGRFWVLDRKVHEKALVAANRALKKIVGR